MIFKRIRDLREDKDLTQRDLAEALRCSQQVYNEEVRKAIGGFVCQRQM